MDAKARLYARDSSPAWKFWLLLLRARFGLLAAEQAASRIRAAFRLHAIGHQGHARRDTKRLMTDRLPTTADLS
jgi:hypothetical protein